VEVQKPGCSYQEALSFIGMDKMLLKSSLNNPNDSFLIVVNTALLFPIPEVTISTIVWYLMDIK
jgi:hypothetical protein